MHCHVILEKDFNTEIFPIKKLISMVIFRRLHMVLLFELKFVFNFVNSSTFNFASE